MKKEEPLKVRVSESIGGVSVTETGIGQPKAVMVLAHGAGAGMHHPFMKDLADRLSAKKIEVIRYNFPFTEQKKKRPDVPAVAMKTVEAVYDFAHARHPGLPLFIAGKSFGGRMSSHALSKECPSYVSGIVFYGFPLHAPGKASTDRADHLKDVACPMLFLQGTRDALASIDMIETVADNLENSTLVKFEGADHSFKSGKNVLTDQLVDATDRWIDQKIRS